ncbi:MAG: hypothetical protein IJL82_03270 [Prevotella sp.]|nr:hypothetical protein [Prevotella sp.]
MKTIKIIATLLMLFAFTANVNAQFLTKEQEKAVKKDVKRYEKEGWKVKPGSPSIAMQLTKSYQMAWEKTAEGTDQWIMGEGSSVGTIYDAARTQAITVAQGEIGRKLRTDLTAQVEQDLANEQLGGGGEAESIAQTIVNSMGKSVDQSIGRPSSLIEMYRDLPNGNVEVLMRLAISSAKLDALAKEAVDKARKEYLQKRVKEVKDKME